MTQKIVETTNVREGFNVTPTDFNVFLAVLLVTGLILELSIDDYFKKDSKGIFGSTWMQKHLTEDNWNTLHAYSHLEPRDLIQQLNNNIKSCWNLRQVVVVDEMMVPFHGRWSYRQYIKGKPHNTGIHILLVFTV